MMHTAQPFPAHSPAADDISLIGYTGHELKDDCSLASTHVGARLGAFGCVGTHV